ncbi:MAG: hypothetical protein QNJ32_17605 [Xenococcaceae cyanobacterium MO_167.B27]|nr:hypothetical protein [Xenococcaceae cyanobacterium MO_167.B27]
MINTIQTIQCPNCGSNAIRRYFTSSEAAYCSCPKKQVIKTECPVCDYLMVMCSLSGSVLEAQFPGTYFVKRSSDFALKNPVKNKR